MKIFPVILAGGAGTRLWPLSRNESPKQFHNLSGNGSLLEETVKRIINLNPELCIIVTSRRYENTSKKELDKIGINYKILAEPYPRNTAAAVLFAALYLSRMGNDSIMIMLPSDHYIKSKNVFHDILRKAIDYAKQDKLVSIGIKPTYPETGYGYIKAFASDEEVLQVEKFVEKPNLEKAEAFLNNGYYFWNSGIFIWKTSIILQYFERLMPEHYNAFELLRNLKPEEIGSNEQHIWSIKERIFCNLEQISIDYGIMERADNRVVIPGDFGWSDLGSWNSIDDILSPDDNINRTPQKDNVTFINSSNCTAFAEGKRITVIGLSNVVIVESGSDILVMDKNSSQDVRKAVKILRGKNLPQ